MKALQFVFLAAFAPCIACAAGAYEINQDCAAAGCFAGDAAGFPVTISQAGSYVLTSDILVSAGANGIDIAAGVSPVDIDLNGHTLDGGGFCINAPVTGCGASTTAGFYGINQVKVAASPAVVHVHDGTIRGFTYTSGGVQPAGIFLGNAADGTLVERVNLLENGGNGGLVAFADVVGTIHVRDSRLSRNRYNGMFDFDVNNEKASVIVENSEFSANGSEGVHYFKKPTITGSRFYNNGGAGFNVSDTVAMGQNVFAGNLSNGQQYTLTAKRDMGGNVCISGTCP